jgi:hypothetical protein
MNPNCEALLLAEASAHSERHQFQSSNLLEVPPVEGGELAATLPGGCRCDQVAGVRHSDYPFRQGWPLLFERRLDQAARKIASAMKQAFGNFRPGVVTIPVHSVFKVGPKIFGALQPQGHG